MSEKEQPYNVIYTPEGDDEHRTKWHGARRLGIGASEAATIVGASDYTGIRELYDRKVHGHQIPDNTPMMVGRCLEDGMIDLYNEMYGKDGSVKCVGNKDILQSKSHPWILATLDGWAHSSEGAMWPVEIKVARDSASWWPYPDQYKWQVFQQCFVTGSDHGQLFALLNYEPRVWDIYFDKDSREWRRYLELSEEFSDRVKRQDPPEPSGSDSEYLNKLFPKAEDHTVELSEEVATAVNHRILIGASMSRLFKRKAAQEAKIKAALGSATWGRLPDGREIAYKNHRRKGYDFKAEEVTYTTYRKLSIPNR